MSEQEYRVSNYIKGSVKRREFGDGRHLLSLSLDLEQLIGVDINKGYVQLSLIPHKNGVDDYGNHYFIVEDDFWKRSASEPSAPVTQSVSVVPDENPDSEENPFN